MKPIVSLILLLSFPLTAAAEERVLRTETIVSAPASQVWKAFTTKQGIEAWMVPHAEVDLRIGGTWKTNYNPQAKIGDPGTIVHHILSYEPERMMSSRFTAPANAPVAKLAEATWSVYRFEPIAPDKTRFTVTMVGWGEGPEWDKAYEFFQKGNEWTLQQLVKHFGKAGAGAATMNFDELMKNKQRSERKISLEKVVPCSPQHAYEMWSTADGLKKFIGEKGARVNPVTGGEFTVVFAPAEDPEALSHGSGGARVLKAVPGREFWFEWPSFVARADLPGGPPLWPEVRNMRPMPTWVELTFTPEGSGTRVKLEAHGFQEGDERWAKSQQYFTNAWSYVLQIMSDACAGKTATAAN